MSCRVMHCVAASVQSRGLLKVFFSIRRRWHQHGARQLRRGLSSAARTQRQGREQCTAGSRRPQTLRVHAAASVAEMPDLASDRGLSQEQRRPAPVRCPIMCRRRVSLRDHYTAAPRNAPSGAVQLMRLMHRREISIPPIRLSAVLSLHGHARRIERGRVVDRWRRASTIGPLLQ